ncbi:hypothetical protein [Clostridium sporogenes]|uniref:hypothetical protein n=1 Tax=Clostridium sporogenes TaxID=1509 RepID=UPI000A61F2AD|nr:hypothetical protein [Clostridium sporogenes]
MLIDYMIKITDEKYKVISIHFMPFDPEYGLHKTKEELEAAGCVFITEIPEPVRIDGKYPIRYWNPKTQKIFYEYEDVPEHEEEIQEERIEKLKRENKELENQLLLQADNNLDGGIL